MSNETNYETFEQKNHKPVKAWVRGVPLDDKAVQQLKNVGQLPIIHGWVAAMPDVHWGIGATVGSVIPTHKAIIPAAVGAAVGHHALDGGAELLEVVRQVVRLERGADRHHAAADVDADGRRDDRL